MYEMPRQIRTYTETISDMVMNSVSADFNRSI